MQPRSRSRPACDPLSLDLAPAHTPSFSGPAGCQHDHIVAQVHVPSDWALFNATVSESSVTLTHLSDLFSTSIRFIGRNLGA